jgi:hypothetical protein
MMDPDRVQAILGEAHRLLEATGAVSYLIILEDEDGNLGISSGGVAVPSQTHDLGVLRRAAKEVRLGSHTLMVVTPRGPGGVM